MSPRSSALFDEIAVRKAVKGSTSQSRSLEALGLKPHADNFRRLQEACERYGLDVPFRPRIKPPERVGRKSLFDDEAEIDAAVRGNPSVSAALRKLGASAAPSNYERLASACHKFGIPYPRSTKYLGSGETRRRDIQAAVERNVEAAALTISKARSCAQALSLLGMTTQAVDYEWLRGFTTDHDIPLPESRRGRRGIFLLTDAEFFVDGVRRSSESLKRRALACPDIDSSGCALCPTLWEWNGIPLVLHLDHINGDTLNNLTSNLRFLCPNCHSQTETYCRRYILENE